MDCIFCAIAEGKIPATVHFQDDEVVVFEDIHPKAPIHLLVIPRVHIVSLAEASEDQMSVLGRLLLTAAAAARDKGLSGYRVAINTGREGGQEVDHLHVHVMGG